MSLRARRHIAPPMSILSNQGCTPKMGREVDHLPTWADDQPNSGDLVHMVEGSRPRTIGDLIVEKSDHSHRIEQTRPGRGESLAD